MLDDPNQMCDPQIRLEPARLLHVIFSEPEDECDAASSSNEQNRRIIGKNDVCQATCQSKANQPPGGTKGGVVEASPYGPSTATRTQRAFSSLLVLLLANA